MKTFKPLVACKPHNGYTIVDGVGRYLNSNLHARINRRVGLKIV